MDGSRWSVLMGSNFGTQMPSGGHPPHHGRVHAGNAEAAGREAELIAADVFDGCPVGRVSKERGEVLDGADVARLSFWPELADGHIFDHAPAQWADGSVGHGGLLSWVRL